MSDQVERTLRSMLAVAAFWVWVVFTLTVLALVLPRHARETYRMVRLELARHAAMQQAEDAKQQDNMNRASMEE